MFGGKKLQWKPRMFAKAAVANQRVFSDAFLFRIIFYLEHHQATLDA